MACLTLRTGNAYPRERGGRKHRSWRARARRRSTEDRLVGTSDPGDPQPGRTNATRRGVLSVSAGSESPPLALGQRSLSAPTNCICGWHQTPEQTAPGAGGSGVCCPRRLPDVGRRARRRGHPQLQDAALSDGPLPDGRAASGELAAHGRFPHLATKVLIRELLSTSSRRRMRRSCLRWRWPSLRRWPGSRWGTRGGKASPVPSSGDARRCSSAGHPLLGPPSPGALPLPSSPHLLDRHGRASPSPGSQVQRELHAPQRHCRPASPGSCGAAPAPVARDPPEPPAPPTQVPAGVGRGSLPRLPPRSITHGPARIQAWEDDLRLLGCFRHVWWRLREEPPPAGGWDEPEINTRDCLCTPRRRCPSPAPGGSPGATPLPPGLGCH